MAELELIRIAEDVPVVPPPEAAVRVTLSATLPLVLMVKVPPLRVLVLSPNVLSPLLSNVALPLLVRVTTVELSVVTALGLPDLAEIQINAALQNDEMSAEELREMAIFITHYVGFPLGATFNNVVEKVVAKRGKER